jgi:hypothetical protein
MNKHIELVKKWLDDPSSVTVEQLRVNTESADSAADAAYAAAYAADYAAYAAYAAAADAANAAYWVKKYEKLTGEKR